MASNQLGNERILLWGRGLQWNQKTKKGGGYKKCWKIYGDESGYHTGLSSLLKNL